MKLRRYSFIFNFPFPSNFNGTHFVLLFNFDLKVCLPENSLCHYFPDFLHTFPYFPSNTFKVNKQFSASIYVTLIVSRGGSLSSRKQKGN